jgi:hypothetical protein
MSDRISQEEMEAIQEAVGEEHGVEREVFPEDEARFSEGQEMLRRSPPKEQEGRFSEGMELDDPSAPIYQEEEEEGSLRDLEP